MKILVIGLGSIGRRHWRNVQALSDDVQLFGVDPAASARQWAAEHGASATFEALAGAWGVRPDAALICTPTGCHAADLAACVEQGVPVYVEKPIAARLTPELVRCLEQAGREGCPVVVAANLRYMPGARQLRRVIHEGSLGELVGIYAHAGAFLPRWRPNRELRDYRRSYSAAAEGGAMLDYAHEFDLLRWWGGEVRRVSALVRRASDLAIASEDVADVLIEFETGISGTLHLDYLERSPRRQVECLFTGGRAVWDVPAQRVELVDAEGHSTVAVDVPDYDVDAGYREALRDFLRTVESPDSAEQVQAGWAGAAALAVIDAARLSAQRLAWVEVDEVREAAGWFPGQAADAQAGVNRELRGLGPEAGHEQWQEEKDALHAQSQNWLRRARRVIPSVTQTLSKGPSQFVQGVSPVYLRRGRGCRVWDVDGHAYVDWIMALGPMILGYADPDVDEAVARQLRDGPTFSLMHPLEVEVAELLTEVIPTAETVRFLKTGSGANSAAVRIARAYTGREMIATSGYHGWHDGFAGTLPLRRGVPEGVRRDVVEFAYNDLDSLRRCFEAHPGQVAAVIMEPMCLHWPADDYLHEVRALAHQHGALFILDEVITGFRWSLGGAQAYFGVEPDLSVFGKALANGLPLAAVVGRREVMDVLEDGVFVSLTHGGETLALAAAKATIEKLRAGRIIERLWERGRQLRQGIGELLLRFGLTDCYRLEGPDCRFAVTPLDGRAEGAALRSLLQQELVRRGVLFGGAHVFSAAHDAPALEQTLRVYEDALAVVRRAVQHGRIEDELLGPVLRPVFEVRPVEMS